jgi:hypothetical protein
MGVMRLGKRGHIVERGLRQEKTVALLPSQALPNPR